MVFLVKSYPYHFVHTILSVPFCPIPFCLYTILSIPFCPYHFVRYHFSGNPAKARCWDNAVINGAGHTTNTTQWYLPRHVCGSFTLSYVFPTRLTSSCVRSSSACIQTYTQTDIHRQRYTDRRTQADIHRQTYTDIHTCLQCNMLQLKCYNAPYTVLSLCSSLMMLNNVNMEKY